MSHQSVYVRELAGWGLDSYKYRPETLNPERAAKIVAQRSAFEQVSPVLGPETERLRELFSPYTERPDLRDEMSGLPWSLGVVDLRSLLAFQRRLAFDPEIAQPSMPARGDWPALFALSFGSPKPLEYELCHDRLTGTLTLRSGNPSLHLRLTNDPSHPLRVHGGCPFLEVARFRNRWFLRDGYHRAYALLRAQVFAVPAVVLEAATIEELGADQPWFFSQEVLFSMTPPRIVDFLDREIVLEYQRPKLVKTLRITMDETLKPATCTGERL